MPRSPSPTRKGSGIAEAITVSLNAQIKNGNYARRCRAGTSSPRRSRSRTNPPGLPKN
jgi:polar amino acid transport system substrate-binding protein